MPSRECRQQVVIDAPVEVVWALVGDPNRHGDWWPTVVDAECDELAEGCQYRGVVLNPRGRQEEHTFILERLEDCREVLIRCEQIGSYTRFLLTDAQGGTFVDASFGINPQSLGMNVVNVVAGRRILRRWLEQSIEALDQAAKAAGARGN